MATLTLKNIPEELYDQLRRSATEARRSLNSEILHRLEAGLRSCRIDPEETLARARVVRRTVGLPVTEEDTLYQLGRNCRTVERNEPLVGPLAQPMDRSSNQFFARTRFSGDQNRRL